MLEVVFAIPFWFEMTATITSAITGALSASREKYDILGTIIIAIIVGLCGGVLRDVLLQDYGIYAFQRPELILACVACAVIVFYFGRLMKYIDPIIDVVDTIQAGMWAIVGAGKALSAGLDIVPAVLMGMLSAVGGGILRDIIMNRPVVSFQPGSFYGTAAVAGSIAFVLMRSNHILDHWSALICVMLVIAIRLGSLAFGWKTKASRDLTVPIVDALAKPVRALRGKDSLPPAYKSERRDVSEFSSHARMSSVQPGQRSTRERYRL